MNLTVTVGAASVKNENRVYSARGNRVTRRGQMALGAQPGDANFEKPVIIGAVRVMAVGTVFQHRGMLPHKRATSLGMAGITVLVDACLFELCRVRRAVRVVAVGAGDLAFS